MTESVETQKGQWTVIELFGHKLIAGLACKDESYGAPLLRVDIPAVDGVPAFTEYYNLTAVYGLHPVSEQVARATAEQVKHTPILVYSPDLITKEQHETAMQHLRDRLANVQRQLSSGEEVEYPDDEEDEWEYDDE